MCFWNFDIDHFHWPQTFPIFRIIWDFCCNRSQLKQQFELKPDLSQTSARPQPDLSQTSARPQLDLNWIDLSLTLLLLLSWQRAREASAFIKNNKRRRLWEPLDPPIVSCFQVGGPFFLKRFQECFFSQKWCQMELQMASKMSQNLIKNKLETKSTKNAGNVINLIRSDLQETRFRMEGL